MSFWKWIQGKLGKGKEPVELSYSRIQAYKKCPWLFKLVYLDGLRSRPNGAMSLGVSLHRALAIYLGEVNSSRTIDLLFQIYDEVWVNEGFTGPQDTLDSYDAGRKMLQNFFEIDCARRSAVVATEKDFVIALQGVKLMGTIDRIDKAEDGVYEVIEYKTQSENWSPGRISSDLQLTLYEKGTKEGLGLSPIRLKYFFLSDGATVPTQRTDEQMEAALRTVFDVAEKIRAKDFEANISHCDRCEFGVLCPKYKKPREMVRV